MYEKEQLRRDMWEFINRSKHKACISSVLQLNGNSIEFFLSTWTKNRSKASLSKFLQLRANIQSQIAIMPYKKTDLEI